ncbi:hypothetical protein TNIN_91291 [Trichonephila inaurata madagascariensis]|uniref:Uncharacterized protein n=1 Tax=Trichonephila inaurata madagascariensis TaxID=2747483 RepID=A0A8X6WRZ7_9ARAC|nr:hypothetical protein TNIN_91291 [Trichonephila inaurata madagascariensis]
MDAISDIKLIRTEFLSRNSHQNKRYNHGGYPRELAMVTIFTDIASETKVQTNNGKDVQPSHLGSNIGIGGTQSTSRWERQFHTKKGT